MAIEIVDLAINSIVIFHRYITTRYPFYIPIILMDFSCFLLLRLPWLPTWNMKYPIAHYFDMDSDGCAIMALYLCVEI